MANKQLVKKLAPADFEETRHTTGLFVHKTKPIMFALIVDDFGVQYIGKADIRTLDRVMVYPLLVTWNVRWKGPR